jgi:hypothetical protein
MLIDFYLSDKAPVFEFGLAQFKHEFPMLNKGARVSVGIKHANEVISA